MHTSPLGLFVSIQTKDSTGDRHTLYVARMLNFMCILLFFLFFLSRQYNRQHSVDIIGRFSMRRYICNELNYRSIPLTLRMLGTPSGLTQPCSQITTLRLSAGVTSYMKLTTVVFGTSLQPARCCPAPPRSVLTSKSGGPGEDGLASWGWRGKGRYGGEKTYQAHCPLCRRC